MNAFSHGNLKINKNKQKTTTGESFFNSSLRESHANWTNFDSIRKRKIFSRNDRKSRNDISTNMYSPEKELVNIL